MEGVSVEDINERVMQVSAVLASLDASNKTLGDSKGDRTRMLMCGWQFLLDVHLHTDSSS